MEFSDWGVQHPNWRLSPKHVSEENWFLRLRCWYTSQNRQTQGNCWNLQSWKTYCSVSTVLSSGCKVLTENLKPEKPAVWAVCVPFQRERSGQRRCTPAWLPQQSWDPLSALLSPDTSSLPPSRLAATANSRASQADLVWGADTPRHPTCAAEEGKAPLTRERGVGEHCECYILNLEQQQQIHILGNFQILFPTTVVTKYQR